MATAVSTPMLVEVVALRVCHARDDRMSFGTLVAEGVKLWLFLFQRATIIQTRPHSALLFSASFGIGHGMKHWEMESTKTYPDNMREGVREAFHAS